MAFLVDFLVCSKCGFCWERLMPLYRVICVGVEKTRKEDD